MMKKCSKCKAVKPYSDFHKNKKGKDGLRAYCKDCNKQQAKQYYKKNKDRRKQYREENKERIKQWYEENKERMKQWGKKYYEENKEKINQRNKQYYEKNKEKFKQRKKQYYEENKEKTIQYKKQYYQENKDKIRRQHKQWREENKERKKQLDKQYRKENKEKIKQYKKQWHEENKEKMRAYHNLYEKQRKKTDPIFRLTDNIRGSIYRSLKNKGYSKNTNTYKILGLEYEDFYTWLNTEASNGLNFDADDVHVDHVIPVSFAKTEEQVLALNHYSNLQLLTSEENLNKKNTYIKQSNLDRVMKHHPDYSMLTKILLNYDYLIF